jgi:hypothetical protein
VRTRFALNAICTKLGQRLLGQNAIVRTKVVRTKTAATLCEVGLCAGVLFTVSFDLTFRLTTVQKKGKTSLFFGQMSLNRVRNT